LAAVCDPKVTGQAWGLGILAETGQQTLGLAPARASVIMTGWRKRRVVVAAERFIIQGTLGAATFLPWVRRHMGKLGLNGTIDLVGPSQLVLRVDGPPDLMDALELGVSLGPIEAWVDRIDRVPVNSAT